MPAPPMVFQAFSGGLNAKAGTFLLADNQARDLLNVQTTKTGAIVKRNGNTTFASPANALTSLFALEETATPYLIGAHTTKLVKITTAGAVSDLKTGLTTGLRWSFAQMPAVGGQGPLFGMNGTDTPQQWDGAAGTSGNWTALSGTLPNGTMCIQHANRLFVAGVTANPSRLYWSALGDPTAWPAANGVDLDPNDGESITGLGLVGPYLVAFKRHKTFLVSDANTGANRRVSDSVGCAAPRSIATSAEGMFFLSDERGVYLFDGRRLTPISDNVQPNIDAIVTGQKANAAGVFYQGHYYLSFCNTGTTNNQTLDYDASVSRPGVDDSWWLHSFASNQFAQWHPPVSAPGLYSAQPVSAIVDQCLVPGAFTDNAAAIKWYWRGPWQSPSFYRRRRFPTPYFRKRLRQVRVMGAGTVDFSLAKDFAAVETLWAANVFGGVPPLTYLASSSAGVFGAADGTVYGAPDGSVFGGGSTIQEARLYSLGVGFAFSLVVGATSSTQDQVHLYAMILADRRDGLPS